jgi:menaquinone-dependent protoporphyrinogen IX oxidase
MKTLIAFATKSGVTGESADIIADVLKNKFGHEVDVVNLKETKSAGIETYDNIFIGSGVRMGRWYGRARKMLKNDFKGKKVVIFLSACSAGDPEKHDQALENYCNKMLVKYPDVQPVAMEAFGGRMKMFGKEQNNYDPQKVRLWAEELGEKLR